MEEGGGLVGLVLLGALVEGVPDGCEVRDGLAVAVGACVGRHGVEVVEDGRGGVYRTGGGVTYTFTTEVTTTVGVEVEVGSGRTVTVLVGTSAGVTEGSVPAAGTTTGA